MRPLHVMYLFDVMLFELFELLTLIFLSMSFVLPTCLMLGGNGGLALARKTWQNYSRFDLVLYGVCMVHPYA